MTKGNDFSNQHFLTTILLVNDIIRHYEKVSLKKDFRKGKREDTI